jgi:beta-galactosidase GanA
MKAGGLDMVAVYIFWIHHEEIEGKFTFAGRRNVSQFFHLANEVGLKVLARVGPWDHGECRNGGHPDWLLAKRIPLRTNSTAYMGYVEKFYAQLALQLKGMFWKDGGPIVAVQVDNPLLPPLPPPLSSYLPSLPCRLTMRPPIGSTF